MNCYKNMLKIKLPKDVFAVYCCKKNIMILSGPKKLKSFKPKLRIVLTNNANLGQEIIITSIPTIKFSNNVLKKIEQIQGKLCSEIKNIVLEITTTLYKKIKLVGVGYRILLPEDGNISNSFRLKLGYSHLIYYCLPSDLIIYCKKFTNATVFGSASNELISQNVSKIRIQKKPEPYKGKGILYLNEKIKLKTGKRV